MSVYFATRCGLKAHVYKQDGFKMYGSVYNTNVFPCQWEKKVWHNDGKNLGSIHMDIVSPWNGYLHPHERKELVEFYDNNQDSLEKDFEEYVSCGEWGSGNDRITPDFWEFIEERFDEASGISE
jgi:hypothetical protein